MQFYELPTESFSIYKTAPDAGEFSGKTQEPAAFDLNSGQICPYFVITSFDRNKVYTVSFPTIFYLLQSDLRIRSYRHDKYRYLCWKSGTGLVPNKIPFKKKTVSHLSKQVN